MRLVIEDAAGTRSVVPFASDEITLGRAREGNTFRLEERNVSRLHARLVRASGVVYIEDLGSLNGTRVNGERISGRRRRLTTCRPSPHGRASASVLSLSHAVTLIRRRMLTWHGMRIVTTASRLAAARRD